MMNEKRCMMAGKKGLAEIGAAITIAIVLGSTLIVINTISPLLESGKSDIAFEEEKDNIAMIDRAITQLMIQATGARRQLDLDIRKGTLIVSGDEERIKIRMEGYSFIQPGTILQEGNIHIESGGGVDSREADINGDGLTDLIISNGILSFAVKKIGNISNLSAIDLINLTNMTELNASIFFINTSNIITMIYNNRTNTGVVPVSAIYINDIPESSYGLGFTTLTRHGTNMGDGSILLYVNSNAGVAYEALFTLRPGADFVELIIKNIEWK